MGKFKNALSKAWSFYGWDFYKWLKGQKKAAIAGAVMLLTWLFVNNSFMTTETAITLGGMAVAALLAVLEFYFKEVELED